MSGLLTVCIMFVAATKEFVSTQEQDGDLRLVGGTSITEGRLEVFYNTSWGTVCDDHWDGPHAAVACRQLGFGDVGVASSSLFFGTGSGPIWLGGISCRGNESRLDECSDDGWGIHNCVHDDAGIVCGTPVDTIPPIIVSCPNHIIQPMELGAPGSFVTWSEPVAVGDPRTVRLLLRSHAPNEFFPVGVTDVTYIFDDASGNMATCRFTVSVTEVDSTPPECVDVPQNIFETVEKGTAGAVVSWTEPTCDDLSGAANVSTKSHLPSTFFVVGDTIVTYTCTDASGNSEMCQFNVTVNERLTTRIESCPNSTTVITCNNEESVSWDTPMSPSDEMKLLVESSHSSGDFFQLGTTTVFYSVKENQSGEAEVCNFRITVKEARSCPAIPYIYIIIAVSVFILIVSFLLVILKKKANLTADDPLPVNHAYDRVANYRAMDMSQTYTTTVGDGKYATTIYDTIGERSPPFYLAIDESIDYATVE